MATPVSNADFRKLLMTPRAPREGDGGATPALGGKRLSRAAPPPKQDAKASGGAGGSGKKRFYAPPGKSKKKGTGDGKPKPQYRDRAKERRKGINKDYGWGMSLLLVGMRVHGLFFLFGYAPSAVKKRCAA